MSTPTANTVRTIDLERFRGALGFSATFECKFGNTRKVSIDRFKTKPEAEGTDTQLAAAQDKRAKERLKATKELIASEEYDAIKKFYAALAKWTANYSVPSFFKDGFRLCRPEAVETIEERYKLAVTTELPALVAKLIAAYPGHVITSRAVLEPVGMFDPNDYPATEELAEKFNIHWNWLSFTVPEGLPPELRQAETEKLQRQFADAGDQITQALRESFQTMIAHAADKLTTAPGEKPKTFRDSTIGNIQEFLDTFAARNLMNDSELEKLVTQARGLLVGLTPQKLRDLAAVRENTRKQFEAIKTSLDGLIVTKASRRFDFSQDAPAPQTPTPENRPEAPALELTPA